MSWYKLDVDGAGNRKIEYVFWLKPGIFAWTKVKIKRLVSRECGVCGKVISRKNMCVGYRPYLCRFCAVDFLNGCKKEISSFSEYIDGQLSKLR
jgi:hypothetical protein